MTGMKMRVDVDSVTGAGEKTWVMTCPKLGDNSPALH